MPLWGYGTIITIIMIKIRPPKVGRGVEGDAPDRLKLWGYIWHTVPSIWFLFDTLVPWAQAPLYPIHAYAVVR